MAFITHLHIIQDQPASFIDRVRLKYYLLKILQVTKFNNGELSIDKQPQQVDRYTGNI